MDEYVALQTLYLLDGFGVSDEFYHELTQVIGSELIMHCTCACLYLCVYKVLGFTTWHIHVDVSKSPEES